MKPSPLNRYFMVVITRGGFDLRLSSSDEGSGAPPTRAAKARRVPSGDHTGALRPCRSSVRRMGSPPAAGITWSWPFFPASRSEMKARRVPSGDQRGAVSRRGPVVKRRGSPPAALTTQMFERYSSFSSDSVVSTKAMVRPSGETWGSPTKRMRVRSCGTMARGVGMGRMIRQWPLLDKRRARAVWSGCRNESRSRAPFLTGPH